MSHNNLPVVMAHSPTDSSRDFARIHHPIFTFCIPEQASIARERDTFLESKVCFRNVANSCHIAISAYWRLSS